MRIPADSHVHTAWSWDAIEGSMRGSCERAVALGLGAIAFTEHLDHTAWTVAEQDRAHPAAHLAAHMAGATFTPPPLDVAGYFAELERCRAEFPGLRILSGVEVGEPHLHAAAVRAVLAAGEFDRVLGSLHCLPDGDGYAEPTGLFDHRDPTEVLRSYLAEVAALTAGSEPFTVLAHIDYPVRAWPDGKHAFDPAAFEDEFRHALRTTAESGRALEVNTRVPLSPLILRWWHEEGGDAITFGSDAHDPTGVARGFRDAVQLAEATGFRPGAHVTDLWARAD